MILYGHDSLQDILGITAADDNSNRIGEVLKGNGNVGIGWTPCIPLDIVGASNTPSFMPSDKEIAVENELSDRIKRLRDSKPSCTVPDCPKEPMGYARKDKEGVLDPYCREHFRDYANGPYYDGAGSWVVRC